MTIVVGVVAGVVFVGLIAALLAWRSASRRLTDAGARAADAEEAVQRAVGSAEMLSNDLADARRRASEADRRADEAEYRSASADARAAGAESELAALRSAGSPAVLEEVERVRLEREWIEVAGPGAALPVAWDGSVAAALAIELEIIREVTGTPSRLERDAAEHGGAAAVMVAGGAVDQNGGWVLAGLGCELLRLVARHADELVVRLEGGRAIVAEAFGAPALGDLSSVEAAVKAAGLSLKVGQTAESCVVWLTSEVEGVKGEPEGQRS
ncbi:MAG TPA: hypothetical protein VFV02_03220 [Acidimicrobiales bacterium]|nr:hypothetical protein [Acidimicrobiales bacterium]